MTAVRQSFVFAIEGGFGEGIKTDCKWIAPPPGSFFNSTQNRAVSRVQGTGSKMWDTVAYGAFTGQWDWTFTLDYDYLEPLYMVFETATRVESTTGNTVTGATYTFSKSDTARVPSFVVRRKILNHDIGGGAENEDELTELYGCVCKSFRFTKNESNSQINVTMTGMYVDEKMIVGKLTATDYTDYSGNLVEYMCMFAKDSTGDVGDNDYVANTDSLAISIENNVGQVFNTCSPIAQNYYEGITNYSFSTSCYSNDPDKYKLRLYGGGKHINNTTRTAATTYRPLTKGMTPIKQVVLKSYSNEFPLRTNTTTSTANTEYPIRAANPDPDNKFEVDIIDCVIKSLTWPKGNGGMLQDSISSAECKSMTLVFYHKGATPPYFDPSGTTSGTYPKNAITSSADPSWPAQVQQTPQENTNNTE